MIIGNFIGIGNSTSNRGEAYSTEYQAVLDRATALGYTQPSSAQQTKQNTLIASLKSAGIWDLLDVFYVFATDGDSDFATLNWKNPAVFQCTKVNGPTFTVNAGFTGNVGSTSYLSTTFNYQLNGVNYTFNSASVGYYQNNNSVTINNVSGAVGASGNISVGTTGGNSYYRINAAGPSDGSMTASSGAGFRFANRSSNNSDQVFLNGLLIDQSTTVASTVANDNMTILRRAAAYSPAQLGMCFAAGDLSAKAGAFYTSWNTYFTSL